MNKKEPKKIWRIKDTEEGKFYLLDETGQMRWSPTEGQSRHKMVNHAFDHGADEVVHDYDNVKYDGSGSRK